MSSQFASPWAFVKSTFVKFCFGLGLASLSYYSFAEVKAWIDGRQAAAAKNRGVGLQEKINALNDVGSGSGSAVGMTQFPLSLPEAVPLATSSPSAPSSAGDVSVFPANSDPTPAPSASPDPGAPAVAAAGNESSPNPGNEGDVMPNGGMDMPVPYAIPYVYDPGSYESGPSAALEDKKPESAGSGISGGNSAGSSSEPIQGVLSPQTYGNAGVNTSASPPSSSSTQLRPQDLAFLTTGLRAMFTAGTVGVNSAGGTASVHTSRWTPNEGLKSELTFSINGSNVSSLIFQVGVNLQGVDGNYTLHVGSGGVITATARNEYRSGQLFRVFDFQISNITIRPGEVLRQIHVTLAFDAASSGNPVVAADSTITFVRTAVPMVQTPWSFNAPAANTDPIVTADQVNYSMSIERLP